MTQPAAAGASPSPYPPISDLVPDVADFPAEIPVDSAEDVVAILYEFVGHLGSDVGSAGYEYHLVQRAGRHAREIQAAIIASVRRSGDELGQAREAREA